MRSRYVIVLVLVFSFIYLACSKDSLKVKYEVSGKATKAAAIEYTANSNGERSLVFNASLPWTYQVLVDRGDTVYLGAIAGDSICVKIYVENIFGGFDLKAQDWDDNSAEARCIAE
ncbi:MAG: MmpS family transport accessory protein [Candidatus Hydrothermia bacterium]